jgi:YggT family protein
MVIPIIINVVDLAYRLYVFILFIRIILSWTNTNQWNPVVQWVHRITDPFLYLIRRLVPLQVGVFDFSPIVALLLLSVLRGIIVGILARLVI